jgi:diadenosine tetraphosphatase ApaH/serine/threonine PP2A family protein phosphatase
MALFSEVFQALPLAAVIDSRVLVVHGGLFQRDGVTLAELEAISRFREPPEEGLMSDLLWSDPQPFPGRGPSKRGVGQSFGPDVTARFLDANGLELLIRSHEVCVVGAGRGAAHSEAAAASVFLLDWTLQWPATLHWTVAVGACNMLGSLHVAEPLRAPIFPMLCPRPHAHTLPPQHGGGIPAHPQWPPHHRLFRAQLLVRTLRGPTPGSRF